MAVVSKTADGVYHIIDGQHRLNAINSINEDEKNTLSKSCFTLTVDVRQGLVPEDEQIIFRTVNLAVPLGALLDETKMKMVTMLENWLISEFKYRFSSSPKPITPNMNLIQLMEKIKSDDVISELYESGLIDSVDDIIRLVKELNEFLGMRFNDKDGYILYQKHADSAGKKHNAQYFADLLTKIEIKGKPCYLGLIPKYRWISFIGHHKRV